MALQILMHVRGYMQLADLVDSTIFPLCPFFVYLA